MNPVDPTDKIEGRKLSKNYYNIFFFQEHKDTKHIEQT